MWSAMPFTTLRLGRHEPLAGAAAGNVFAPTFYVGDAIGSFNWWMRLLAGFATVWLICPHLAEAFADIRHSLEKVIRSDKSALGDWQRAVDLVQQQLGRFRQRRAGRHVVYLTAHHALDRRRGQVRQAAVGVGHHLHVVNGDQPYGAKTSSTWNPRRKGRRVGFLAPERCTNSEDNCCYALLE
jgi:hypothetical protein